MISKNIVDEKFFNEISDFILPKPPRLASAISSVTAKVYPFGIK